MENFIAMGSRARDLGLALVAFGEAMMAQGSVVVTSVAPVADEDMLAVWKKPDGRMADAGVSALYAELAREPHSKGRKAEIMTMFAISSSGFDKRRYMWLRGRR